MYLKNGSQAFEYWLSPPATVLRKYYFFDILNPIEAENGAKPIVAERGPYVYKESWSKANLKFHDENTLTYSPVISLNFEPSLSKGSLEDKITFLNVPAAV